MNLIERLAEQAKKNPKRIVFPEGNNPEISVVKPIVLVNPEKEIERLTRFSEVYAKKQQTSSKIAMRLCRRSIFFGAMMVATGEADGMVAGIDAATAYGPIVQGFNRPINDLFRGATAKDVYGVAVITALLG